MDAIATALIVLGAVVTTMFGSHSAQDYTPGSLNKVFQSPQAVMFEMCAWCFMAFLALVQCQWGSVLGERFGATLYALIAGCAGAQQFSFLKAVVDILKTCISGEDGGETFFQMQTYGFIACTVLFALWQVNTLNKGLAKYDIVLFLPLYNSFLIIGGILCGTWIYNEFNADTMTWTQIGTFCGGAGIQCAGILMLTCRQSSEREEHVHRRSSSVDGALVMMGGTPVRNRSRAGSLSTSRRSSIDSRGGMVSVKMYDYGSLDGEDKPPAGEIRLSSTASSQLSLAGLAVYNAEDGFKREGLESYGNNTSPDNSPPSTARKGAESMPSISSMSLARQHLVAARRD